MGKRQGKQSVNGKQPGKTTNATTNAEASVPVHPGSLVMDSSNQKQFIGKLEVIQKHATKNFPLQGMQSQNSLNIAEYYKRHTTKGYNIVGPNIIADALL